MKNYNRTNDACGEGHRLDTVRYDDPYYYRAMLTDDEHRPLSWYDSEGNHEEFRYEIIGYNKKGEPEWQSVVINSNIKLVINEKKFNGDAVAYKRELEKL